MPSVSVIIPVYNRAETLKRAVESVLDQTFQDWELIIVDDGSFDRSVEIAEELAARDPRVRLVKRARNGGISAARNSGFSAASTESSWIAFLDSDDEWFPQKLEKQFALIEERQTGGNRPLVVLTTCEEYYSKHSRELNDSALDGFCYERMLLGARVVPSSAIVHRDVFEELEGFDPELEHGEDRDFFLRASKRFSYATVSEPLTRRYHSEANQMTRLSRFPEKFYRKWRGEMRRVHGRKCSSTFLMWSGLHRRRVADFTGAFWLLWRAVAEDPFHGTAWRALISTVRIWTDRRLG